MYYMHEISVMNQIIEIALREIEKKNAKDVKEIDLDVGDLTFLGHEQLSFAFEVLSKNTLLANAKLTLNIIKPLLKCSCGFEESKPYEIDPVNHYYLPKYSCPKCNSKLEIVSGNECTLKKIVVET